MHQTPKRAIFSEIRDRFSFMCFVVFFRIFNNTWRNALWRTSTSFLCTHLAPNIHRFVFLVSCPDKCISPSPHLLLYLIESKFSVLEVTLRFHPTSLFCKRVCKALREHMSPFPQDSPGLSVVSASCLLSSPFQSQMLPGLDYKLCGYPAQRGQITAQVHRVGERWTKGSNPELLISLDSVKGNSCPQWASSNFGRKRHFPTKARGSLENTGFSIRLHLFRFLLAFGKSVHFSESLLPSLWNGVDGTSLMWVLYEMLSRMLSTQTSFMKRPVQCNFKL